MVLRLHLTILGVLIVIVPTACRAPAPSSAARATRAASAADTARGSSGPKPFPRAPGEAHFAVLEQLTFGGENAEAYWSPDGRELILQAHGGPGTAVASAPHSADGNGCDRIYRLPLDSPGAGLVPVSSGLGATTCSFFVPGTDDVIFSSTHLGGAACPPPPDRSRGYVWAIYPTYDIFRARKDGTNLRRLTDTPGYDAEATVCPRDGSIVFTSVRDGDLDIYRMNADGTNVKRLTSTLGYDGGPVFDGDCTHIAWRASRPHPGPERDEYQELLRRGLVRPTKLELWMAEADGSNAHQVTYLDAASFGPAFYPSAPGVAERRIVFSSNHGDPRGREFDLWAIDGSGARLERLTSAPGFDGFPMFSPDGRKLAFASNRATAPGQHDTNVFVASWDATVPVEVEDTAADRVLADIRWLADPAREGRGVGTAGLAAAGAYLEDAMKNAGLAPAGEAGTFRQSFELPVSVEATDETALILAGKPLAREAFVPAAYAGQGKVAASLVLAGHGIVDAAAHVDDYAGVKAKGKIVVVRRFAPENAAWNTDELKRRAGDVRRKAFVAREHGARALIVVDQPLAGVKASAGVPAPEDARLPSLHVEGYGDAGLPVVFVKRAAFAETFARLEQGLPVRGEVRVALRVARKPAFNVVGRVVAGVPANERLPGLVVFGAHYDHLGFGDLHSLAPESHLPHVGADDNASGVATLLEAAKRLVARRAGLRRDVLVVAFSGEEAGTLGSTHFTRTPPPGVEMKDVVAMVNLDMVGRLRDNRATVLGRGSAEEWPALLDAACASARIDCTGTEGGEDGVGPSDQMPFALAGIPVAHFFTGAHGDYHKPSDTADKINAAGAAQIAVASASLVEVVADRADRLVSKRVVVPPSPGDMRTFGASLGTIPDYAGPPHGAPGVLLAGVRPGGPAEAAGLRRGDILVKLGTHDIRTVEDFMYALAASKPGETATAVVLRDGKETPLAVTFQAGRH